MGEQTLFRDELMRRMAAPQRHRLLQGYPMVPLMRRAAPPGNPTTSWRALDGRVADEREPEPPYLTLDPGRPLLIGVIPHTQCNPRLKACGFCTFGQDRYFKPSLIETVAEVRGEITSLAERWPELGARRVDAVYFGGGTANLTPARELRELGATLARHFDLRGAEVTLEGVPALFRSLLAGPFEALLELPVRHRRLSMGVQSFDPKQLERMGRERFGDRDTVARVVKKAHQHGLTASADLLFNLPHQSRAQMLEDVRIAVGLGLDQVCIYHLVLHPEQDTPWSREPELLAALPSIEEAEASWLALRELLLSQGFVQTTLTNFERAEVHESARRFRYEECSFTPQTYDALGFGPLAITTLLNYKERRALKFFRSRRSMLDGGRFQKGDLYFPYEEADLKLLHLTRSLPRLRVERAPYRDLLGSDLADDFAEPLAVLGEAGLVALTDDALVLSPRGMYYADTVAGLLAWTRAEQVRGAAAGRHTRNVLHESVHASMG